MFQYRETNQFYNSYILLSDFIFPDIREIFKTAVKKQNIAQK